MLSREIDLNGDGATSCEKKQVFSAVEFFPLTPALSPQSRGEGGNPRFP